MTWMQSIIQKDIVNEIQLNCQNIDFKSKPYSTRYHNFQLNILCLSDEKLKYKLKFLEN